MIDPSFWTDEKLGTLSPYVRLLFMGLISQADDDGRLNGHPALIRSLIFPYDMDITVNDVEEWLASLHERNVILRYEVDHQKYIAVINFSKHQTINKKQDSKLPPPVNDDYGSTTVVVDGADGNAPAQKKRREEEEKRKESEEEEEEVSSSSSEYESFFSAHKRLFKFDLSQHQVEAVSAYIDQDGIEEQVVIRAMEIMAKNATGGYGIKFFFGVMDAYRAAGVKTLEAAELFDNQREQAKQQRNRGQPGKTGTDKPKLPVYKGQEEQPVTDEEYEEILRRVRERAGSKQEESVR